MAPVLHLPIHRISLIRTPNVFIKKKKTTRTKTLITLTLFLTKDGLVCWLH